MQNLWLFSFSSFLPAELAGALADRLKATLATWKAHGTPVSSKVALRYGHFLFIEATSDASGCSIDWLQHTVTDILAELGVQLAPHSDIFYWAGEEIRSVPFQHLETALASEALGPETIVFDPQVVQTGQFERWEVPLRNTWMARYLPKSVPTTSPTP